MDEELLAWLVPMAFATFAGAFLILRLNGVGSFWWPGAFGAAALAFALTILPVGPWPSLKATFEDTLFLVAVACFACGIGARFKRRPRRWLIAPVMLLGSGGAFFSLALHQSVQAEVIFVQTACAILLGEAARLMMGATCRSVDKLLLSLIIGLAASLLLQNAMLVLMLDESLTVHGWRLSLWAYVFQMSGAAAGLLFAITILFAIGIDLVEALRLSSATDPLSGLLNRRGFEEASRRFEDERGEGAVLIIDVDRFKSINDNFGHGAGDLTIAGIGAMLSTFVGGRGIAARLGGEEFAILLTRDGTNGAAGFAERLRRLLASIEWPAPLEGTRVTASIGVSLLAAGEPVSMALRRADANLYRAKRNGRNQVVASQAPAMCAAA